MRQTGRQAVLVVAFLATVVVTGCGATSSTTSTGTSQDGQHFVIAAGSSDATRRSTARVLETRARALGGSAQLSGGDIVVRVPGGSRNALALIAAGHIGFRPVLAAHGAPDAPGLGPAPPAVTPPGQIQPDRPVVLAQHEVTTGRTVAILELGPEVASGSMLESARADLSPARTWEVRPVFRPGASGIDQFNRIAAGCFATGPRCPALSGAAHGSVAITLDGVILTAPTIDAPSFKRDQITISGDYTPDEARILAAILSSGELPATVEPVSTTPTT